MSSACNRGSGVVRKTSGCHCKILLSHSRTSVPLLLLGLNTGTPRLPSGRVWHLVTTCLQQNHTHVTLHDAQKCVQDKYQNRPCLPSPQRLSTGIHSPGWGLVEACVVLYLSPCLPNANTFPVHTAVSLGGPVSSHFLASVDQLCGPLARCVRIAS